MGKGSPHCTLVVGACTVTFDPRKPLSHTLVRRNRTLAYIAGSLAYIAGSPVYIAGGATCIA